MATGTTFFEEDRSLSSSSSNLARYMFTIRARKGPLGPVEIRNYEKIKRVYGPPVAGVDDHLALRSALDGGAMCIVSRVVHFGDIEDIDTCTAIYAEETVGDGLGAAGPAKLTSTAGPHSLDPGDTGTIDVNGVTTLITFSATAASRASEDPGGGATGWNLGGENLIVKVKDSNGDIITYEVEFDDTPSGLPAVVDPDNYTQLETAAQLNKAIGGQNATKSGNTVVMTADLLGSGSYIKVDGGTANAILNFSTTAATGTGNVPNSKKIQAADTVAWLTGLAIANVTFQVNPDDPTKWDMISTATGSGVHLGWDAGLMPPKFGFTNGPGGDATGTDADASQDTLRFYAESRSSLYNNLQFIVADNTDDSDKFDITIPLQSEVIVAEKHVMLDMDPNSPRYVVKVLAEESSVLRAENLGSSKEAPYNNPAPGTYTLSGGEDGLSGIVNSDFVGHVKTGTGVHAFDNVETAQDLFVPGMNHRPTVEDIIGYVDNRGDVNYIFCDFPKPNDVDDMVHYRNATGPYAGQGSKFNSSHFFMYGGRPKDVDFTGQTREIAGSGHVARVYAFNDTGGGRLLTGYGIQYPPAGTKRALVRSKGLGTLNVGSKSLVTERAVLEEAQINMFADFGSGVQLHDERTSQIAPTLLREIHVRRLLNQLKRDTVAAVRTEEWEPLDPIFFKTVVAKVESVWMPYTAPSKRALAAVRILGDQDVDTLEDVQVNTLEELQLGRYRMYIFFKPYAAAREIQLVSVVTKLNANFDEITL